MALVWAVLGCASSSPPPPPYNPGDPISMLPEKRRVFYWKKACDDPEERAAQLLGNEGDFTILWKAHCADGRVLRCSYHRLMKCRWDKGVDGTRTATGG
jgi:hypothetical protein